MHNMKIGVASAMDQFCVRSWVTRIKSARKVNFTRIANTDCTRWEKRSMDWDPTKLNDVSQEYVAHRRPGRPLLRWTDTVINDLPNEYGLV